MCVSQVVYTWGLSFDGQTGHGKRYCVRAPSPLEALRAYSRPVVDIATGGAHMLAIMADGAVFVWGNGDGGLGVVDGFMSPDEEVKKNGKNPGFDETGAIVDSPSFFGCPSPAVLPVPTDQAVIAAAAGQGHTVLLTVPVTREPLDSGAAAAAGWFDPKKAHEERLKDPKSAFVYPCKDEIDEVFACCRHNRPKTLASILEGEFFVDVRCVSCPVDPLLRRHRLTRPSSGTCVCVCVCVCVLCRDVDGNTPLIIASQVRTGGVHAPRVCLCGHAPACASLTEQPADNCPDAAGCWRGHQRSECACARVCAASCSPPRGNTSRDAYSCVCRRRAKRLCITASNLNFLNWRTR